MGTQYKPLINDNVTNVDEYLASFLDKDSLVDQWMLTKTPYPSFILLCIYFLFVLKIGPRFMENRRPFELNTVMRVYNIFQVLGNIRLLYYPFIAHFHEFRYIFLHLSCVVPKETDAKVDELSLSFLNLLHWYFVLKIMDLLDTVFMVLRKKDSQITFLHMYHHGTMVFGAWYTVKYLKTLQSVLPGIINVCVHTVMYSYFFLATFGEPVKKYLWWKRYLTKLQLAQFVFIMIYIFSLYYNECAISKTFTYFWLFNVFIIFCLFVNFYVRTYLLQSDRIKPVKIPKKRD